MKPCSIFARAAVYLIASAIPLAAQSYQGGIRGSIADSGGAVVGLAKVTLIDESTSVLRATVTNESGKYVFNAVEPATYTVRAEAPSSSGSNEKA